MTAIAARLLPAGSLVAASDLTGGDEDFVPLAAVQRRRRVLARAIPAGSPVLEDDFRPARIGTIVACRLKSSRLERKGLLPLHGVPSVDRCLRQCRDFPADVTVLAISTDSEDDPLAAHDLGADVALFRGHPDDVIRRYLDAADRHRIDVAIRVTADCPIVSVEIANQLIDSHFEAGADFTAARKFAVGLNSEIVNVEALQRVIDYLGEAPLSEYMSWYMTNNTHIFKNNIVDLPPHLVRDYRLTLDYPQDAEMFDALFRQLEAEGKEAATPNVFAILDSNPQLAAINAGLTLKYRSDAELIERLNRETRIAVPADEP